MCPSDKRFLLLFTFLQKFKSKKIMVFFSSCNSVKFHSDLLNYIDISVLDIHGRQKQSKRMSVYYEFCNAKVINVWYGRVECCYAQMQQLEDQISPRSTGSYSSILLMTLKSIFIELAGLVEEPILKEKHCYSYCLKKKLI